MYPYNQISEQIEEAKAQVTEFGGSPYTNEEIEALKVSFMAWYEAHNAFMTCEKLAKVVSKASRAEKKALKAWLTAQAQNRSYAAQALILLVQEGKIK
jgi:hypothetical protein